MSIDADLRRLMPHSVTIALYSGMDGYGKRSFGAGTSYTARVVAHATKVRDAQGREILAKTVIYIDGVSGLTTEGKITLPDGSTPPILAVDVLPIESGNYYERVACG